MSGLVFDVNWGSVAEWVAGIGSLLAAVAATAAALVALTVSRDATDATERNARETRKAMARDRTADLLVQLIRAVEGDVERMEGTTKGVTVRSLEGQALCRALWGHRNLFGTTWAFYCEPDQAWVDKLLFSGE